MLNTNENCSFLTMLTLLQTICTKFTKANNEKFVPQGITPSQAKILLFLENAGAQRVHDIALALNMIESNISSICSRLEKAGFVKRQRQKDDMRVVKISLTEKAMPKIAELKEYIAVCHENMRVHISEEDVHEICAGLTKLDTLLDLLLESFFCRKT